MNTQKIICAALCLLTSNMIRLYGDLEVCNVALDRLNEVGTALRDSNVYAAQKSKCQTACTAIKNNPYLETIDPAIAARIEAECDQCEDAVEKNDIPITTANGTDQLRYFGQFSWQIKGPPYNYQQQQQTGKSFLDAYNACGKGRDCCTQYGGSWDTNFVPKTDTKDFACIKKLSTNPAKAPFCDENMTCNSAGKCVENDKMCCNLATMCDQNCIVHCENFFRQCCKNAPTKVPCDTTLPATWNNEFSLKQTDWDHIKNKIIEFLAPVKQEWLDQTIVERITKYNDAIKRIDSFYVPQNRLVQLKTCTHSGKQLPTIDKDTPLSKAPLCCYKKPGTDGICPNKGDES